MRQKDQRDELRGKRWREPEYQAKMREKIGNKEIERKETLWCDFCTKQTKYNKRRHQIQPFNILLICRKCIKKGTI